MKPEDRERLERISSILCELGDLCRAAAAADNLMLAKLGGREDAVSIALADIKRVTADVATLMAEKLEQCEATLLDVLAERPRAPRAS